MGEHYQDSQLQHLSQSRALAEGGSFAKSLLASPLQDSKVFLCYNSFVHAAGLFAHSCSDIYIYF